MRQGSTPIRSHPGRSGTRVGCGMVGVFRFESTSYPGARNAEGKALTNGR